MEWLSDVVMSDVEGPPLGDRILLEILIFLDKDGKRWDTPPGTVGDLSSFPAFLRMFIPKTSFAKSPWPHDYGYTHQPEGVTRKEWDEIYRQGCIAEMMQRAPDQPPPTKNEIRYYHAKARAFYLGLRIGGGVTWALNRRKVKRGTVRPLVEV